MVWRKEIWRTFTTLPYKIHNKNLKNYFILSQLIFTHIQFFYDLAIKNRNFTMATDFDNNFVDSNPKLSILTLKDTNISKQFNSKYHETTLNQENRLEAENSAQSTFKYHNIPYSYTPVTFSSLWFVNRWIDLKFLLEVPSTQIYILTVGIW